MKKLSLALVVLFFVSIAAYGADYWYSPNPTCIRPISGYTRVGIGTNSPNYELEVIGQMRATGNAYFSSKVGIGTTSPAVKLHVNGSIRGNQSGALRISTGYGYVDIGPKNTNYAQFYTDRAQYYFDKEIRVDGGYIGSYNENLSLRTEGTTRMTILNSNGNVGIGKDNPQSQLDINGTVQMSGFELPTGAANDYVLTSDANGVGTWQSIPLKWLESGVSDIYFAGGNVGIGTSSPVEELDVVGTVKMDSFKLPTGAVDGYILTSDGSGVGTWQSMPLQWFGSGNDIYYNTGNVCVGTDTPESELTVDGTITTREMKVQLTGWPDFVFEDNYKLMSLNKLEKHIKKERSLPGIPTNKEVVKEGVYVGEMQAKLLEKVEELTLYVIELNREVGDLREENEDLRQKISALVK